MYARVAMSLRSSASLPPSIRATSRMPLSTWSSLRQRVTTSLGRRGGPRPRGSSSRAGLSQCGAPPPDGHRLTFRTYSLPQVHRSARYDAAAVQQLEDDIRRDLAADAGGEHTGTTIALGLYANLPLPSPDDQCWSSPIRRNFDHGEASDPALGYMLERELSVRDWVRARP